jgi:hypothetical protein
MAWPLTAVLGVLAEMQLTTGEWVDITTYVYADPGAEEIAIQRGRTAEAFGVEPSSATFKLNDQDGRFSYRNPRSPYSGLIGRNTPVRLSVLPRLSDTTTNLADLTDTFTRTVAAGDSWGTSDSGQTWSKSSASAANKLSVSSGTGRLLISTANTTVRVVLDNGSYTDTDLYATFTTPVSTGAALVPYIVTERRDSLGGNAGILQVTTTLAGAVQLQVFANSQLVSTQLGATVTVSGLVHTGQALRTRVKFSGNTTMAKVWDASGVEPAAWGIIRQDTTANGGSGIQAAPGTIAIACTAPVGNTNVPFTAQYDNIAMTAIEPRFCGEFTSLPVRWTKGAPETGTVWIPVTAHGVLSRLANTNEQPKSALWRYMEQHTSGLIGYWTLAEGEPAGLAGAEFQRPMLGTITTRPISTGGAAVMLAAGIAQHGALAPWLENGAVFSQSGFITLDRVNGPVNAGAGWSVEYVRAGGQNSTAATQETLILNTDINGAAPNTWTLAFQDSTTSSNVVITDPNAVTHTASLAASGVYDGGAHAIRFTTAKSGTNITYNLRIDGTSIASGTVAAPDTIGAGRLLTPEIQTGATQTVTYGHFAVWDDTAPAASGYADAALGHPNEVAVTRIARVAAERGISYYVLGTASEALGQQPIGTDYDILVSAAATDQGVLTDLRDAVGVLFYARNSLYSQAALALTYTTDGHLQEAPEPTDDTATTVNISTVTRTFASSKTYELTAGALGTANPPAGVGRKAGDATLNLDDDDRTLHMAEWLVSLGTVDDSRWPLLSLSLGHLATHGLTGLLASAIRLDSGFRVTVGSPPDFLAPAQIDQLVLGLTETLDQYTWTMALNCGPFRGYHVGIWDGAPAEFAGRWDTDQSTLAAGVTSSATSLSVATASGALWTTTAGDFPFDIGVSGVRLTVTNISGASSPQTFTVTRSVDGFDLALSSGAAVRLWKPTRWGL